MYFKANTLEFHTIIWLEKTKRVKLTELKCLFDGAALQYKKRGMNANLITDNPSKQRLPE